MELCFGPGTGNQVGSQQCPLPLSPFNPLSTFR